jgi:hypothetical protein
MAGAIRTPSGPQRGRSRRLTLPIDPERDTRWALVELLYGLIRDAHRRWRLIRSRRWWKVLVGIVVTITAADHRYHLLTVLLQHLA